MGEETGVAFLYNAMLPPAGPVSIRYGIRNPSKSVSVAVGSQPLMLSRNFVGVLRTRVREQGLFLLFPHYYVRLRCNNVFFMYWATCLYLHS